MGDLILRAVAQKEDLRFIVIKNSELVRGITLAHGCTGAALAPFGNVITSAQLLGTQVKGQGAVSMRLEGNGAIRSIMAEANPFGLTRGLIRAGGAGRKVEEVLTTTSPAGLVGRGTLSVERRISATAPAYTGIVEIASDDVAASVAHYLEQSEQIESFIGLATVRGAQGGVQSGGFMVQAFPGSDRHAIATLKSNLARYRSFDDLIAPHTAEELLAELSHGIETMVLRTDVPEAYCPCSRERFLSAMAALPAPDVQEMIDDGKDIETMCDYCCKEYSFPVTELAAMVTRRAESN
jgi:molecular chaperone Hsp33